MGSGRVMNCDTCGASIQSKHRHDFVSCGCTDSSTRISIDGGGDYERVLFGSKAKWHFPANPETGSHDSGHLEGGA